MKKLSIAGKPTTKEVAELVNEIVDHIETKPKTSVQAYIDSQQEGAQVSGVTRKEYENLVNCLERVATLTGNGNILLQYGFKRWEPSKQDMSKYKD